MTRLLTAVRSGLERGRVMRNVRMSVPATLTPVETAAAVMAAATVHDAASAQPTDPAVTDAQNGVALDQPLREARDQFERVYFEYHLARENYSMTRVADRAGLERTHLYRKLKQLGIELARGARRNERSADETAVTHEMPATSAETPAYSQRTPEYD